MEATTDLVQLLMETGYLATNIGLFDEAQSIFRGVQTCRQDSPCPDIGLAVLEISRGRYRRAIKILTDRALKKDPTNDVARCFLGLAMAKAGLGSQCNAMYDEVIKAQRDPAAVAMATSLQGSSLLERR